LLGDKLDLDEIFDNMDVDRNGSVLTLRWPLIVSRTAHCASNAFAQISFRELLVWLGVYLKGSEEEKLKHIFDAFDQDGNKVLDHSEITNVLMVRAAFPFSPLRLEWPSRFVEAYRSCFTPV
jgi:hypothetical protein